MRGATARRLAPAGLDFAATAAKGAWNIAHALGRSVVGCNAVDTNTPPPPPPPHFTVDATFVASTPAAVAATVPVADSANTGGLASALEPVAVFAPTKTLEEGSAVPSSRVARAAGFGSLLVKLAWGRATHHGEGLLPPSSHEAVVATLCRMRGAALKLGQMLSIQDEATVPAGVTALFARVRDAAVAMPAHQLDAAMREAFAPLAESVEPPVPWRNRFVTFSDAPFAAASIGQVHFATIHARDAADNGTAIATVPPAAPIPVAVKVQYPGVARSIDSDIANLRMLMKMHVLPPGLFVGNILAELRAELARECRYDDEGRRQQRYAALVASDPALAARFRVPRVFARLTSPSVLTSEFLPGVPIDRMFGAGEDKNNGNGIAVAVGSAAGSALAPSSALDDAPQATRDAACEALMRLTLTELFLWRFMQTDPNFSNFLWDARGGRIGLIDFGAAREYDAAFVLDYLDVVEAAQKGDRATVIDRSVRLGFLTGKECAEMLDAHVASVFALGLPFRHDRQRAIAGSGTGAVGFDFKAENLPAELQRFVPTMLRLRLRPPPTPIYSLHRRLSGTILLSTRLRARYDCASLFDEIRAAARAKLVRDVTVIEGAKVQPSLGSA